jgi:4-hydroxythreonine-4-phosphate dehydrogenase
MERSQFMPQPIIVTMGDPSGIGPEVIVKAFAMGTLSAVDLPLAVAGDAGVLLRAAEACGISAHLAEAPGSSGEKIALILNERPVSIQSLSRIAEGRAPFGSPDSCGGQAMAAYIEWACAECLAGRAAGMVTAPINKEILKAAGFAYPGHTELLTERCGLSDSVMMLAGERLRVCLVTTHCAYREVPRRLSREKILSTLRIVAADFKRYFGCRRPRLAVLALNPHAGEAGLFGDEEVRLIAPAIAAAQAEGIDASGPHSADSLFWFAVRGDYDAVICMYHDQGLIPLKLLHFEDAVNVTLGLPIIRTSVDHGTAYDLAGTGRANPASLVAAIKMAAAMIKSEREAGQSPATCQPAPGTWN